MRPLSRSCGSTVEATDSSGAQGQGSTETATASLASKAGIRNASCVCPRLTSRRSHRGRRITRIPLIYPIAVTGTGLVPIRFREILGGRCRRRTWMSSSGSMQLSAGGLDPFLAEWDPDAEYSAAIQQAVEGESGLFPDTTASLSGSGSCRTSMTTWRPKSSMCAPSTTGWLSSSSFAARLPSSGHPKRGNAGPGHHDGAGEDQKARDYRSPAEALEAVGLSE